MGGPAPRHRRRQHGHRSQHGHRGTGPGTAGSRVLFRAELGTEAHMGPTGRYDKLRYEAEVLAFIVTATEMPATPEAQGVD